MKFVELKKELNLGLKKAYLFFGEDVFLRNSAQKMIVSRCDQHYPEFNFFCFNEENFDEQKLFCVLKTCPFQDEKKIIVIEDVSPKKEVLNEINKVLKSEANDFCIIFNCEQPKPELKGLFEIAVVDCSQLDEQMAQSLIVSTFAKEGFKIEQGAVLRLIDCCNLNMNLINQEISKLKAFCSDTKIITTQDVSVLVSKNIEFATFQLSNAIAEKKSIQAFEILKFLQKTKEKPQKLLVVIANVFRRMFYAAITKESDEKIAEMLGVKPYSIKIAKQVAKNFSPKKLMSILEYVGELDYQIKNNTVSEETALANFVCFALSI